MAVLFVVLLLAVVTALILRRQRRRRSLYRAGRALILRANPQGEAPPTERWLLAANAIYSVWLERPVDKLMDLEGRPQFKHVLEGQWGVQTRDDLLRNIAQLTHQGARRPMRALQRAEPSLPQQDLLAFDLARALHLCVAGCTMGLLTPEETQVLMLHPARALQRTYGSWAEYGEAFVAGMIVNRVHKSIERTPASDARLRSLREAVQVLTHQRTSPWQQVAWSAPLPEPAFNDFSDRALRAHLSEVIVYIREVDFTPSSLNWALAVAAIYRAWWGDPIDLLVCDDPHIPEILQRDWGIHDRDGALDTLMWLHHEGHRAPLRALQARQPSAPQADVLAWDLVRMVQVTVNAASVGHLTPQEAENLLLHASRALQDRYASWEALADGYRAGRVLWRRLKGHGAEAHEQDGGLDRTLTLLREDPASPWLKVPWSTPLPQPEARDFFTRVAAASPHGHAVQDAPPVHPPDDRLLN